MSKHIFLTGATGFVGRNLIPRILDDDPENKLTLLVRATTPTEGQQRVEESLQLFCKKDDISRLQKRIEIALGDITLPLLGFTPDLYNRLTQKITHVIHSAANVNFQLPLSQSRLNNVYGTENVLDFAREAFDTGNLKRLAYVSTAYVCGDREGTIYEDELNGKQHFSNSYEQSKYEAEQKLKYYSSQLPITIFRPSIIVGHSKTGITSAFNVLYHPLKLLYKGVLKIIPGSPHTQLDVVPIDYVCDAICHIFLNSEQGIGKTFHLTEGSAVASTAGEIVEGAVHFFNRVLPTLKVTFPRFISPVFFHLLRPLSFSSTKVFLNKMEQYIPYLSGQKNFDTSNTRTALAGTTIHPPRLREYFDILLQYCVEVDWGKKLSTNP